MSSGIGSANGEVVSVNPATANVAAPLGAQAPVAAPVAQQNTATDSNSVNLPSSAFKRLKDEAQAKGMKKAMNELENKAKAAGFASLDAMFEAATSNGTSQKTQKARDVIERNTKEATVPPPPKKTGNATADRERERLYREKLKLQSKLERESQRRREALREKDALEARMDLERTASRMGIRDLDYAIHLLEKEISGKDENALMDFDERTFFEGLRGQHPYLWGETVVPATTGNATAAAPSAPRPNTVTQQTAAAQQVDVRKMNRQEYEAHLRSRGLAVGMH